jgi:hypothetical protein
MQQYKIGRDGLVAAKPHNIPNLDVAPSGRHPTNALEFVTGSWPRFGCRFDVKWVQAIEEIRLLDFSCVMIFPTKDSREVGIFYLVQSIPPKVIISLLDNCQQHKEEQGQYCGEGASRRQSGYLELRLMGRDDAIGGQDR